METGGFAMKASTLSKILENRVVGGVTKWPFPQAGGEFDPKASKWKTILQGLTRVNHFISNIS
jgi:hypothetical protein